ncbi:MAG: type II secretion system F family protein [Deltaproteobacteria bacterium]|nr:type II secretion system F family protein [Deltaproteobacteria bacterium]
MICPNCQTEVPEGPECIACGVVIEKFMARQEQADQAPTANAQPAPASRPGLSAPPQSGPEVVTTERPQLFKPVSDSRLAALYGQIARMLESGIALTEVLSLVAGHSSGRLRATMIGIRSSIESGATLADAMAADPAIFPDHVRSLIDAGEQTGGLPAVFYSLSEAIELRLTMRRRIVRGCIYPFVLFTLSFFLIPLSKLFIAGLGAYLKASLVPYLFALLILFGFVFLLPWGLRKLLGPARTQSLARAIPVVGKLQILRTKVRFSRHLSTALGAGLDLHAALRLSARATGDQAMLSRIEQVIKTVQGGATLTEALGGIEWFDDEFMLSISSGELSGRLEEALDQQARISQDSFIHRLQIVVQLVAVFVLLLVYAYVAWSIMSEYQNILGNAKGQLDQIMKEMGGNGAGLETLLKEMGGPMGSSKLPPEMQDLLNIK